MSEKESIVVWLMISLLFVLVASHSRIVLRLTDRIDALEHRAHLEEPATNPLPHQPPSEP